MSAPKRGLGRGLGALLGEPRPSAAPSAGYVEVPVESIRPNPHQPRQTFDDTSLAELTQSIRELGVVVPLIVRPLAGGLYELVAGERRWRAATAAGLRAVPAIVRDVDDRSSLELAVVENLQRQDLDPLEEAMGYQHLIDKFGFTQERVAERLGRARPTIANALRLLGLSDAVKAHVRARALSAGHARALLGFEDDEREAMARRAIAQSLSVRELERLVAERRSGDRPPTEDRKKSRGALSADVVAVEAQLRYRLGAPVAIVPSGSGGGRIEVRYADADDLTRIVDVLLDTKP